MIMDHKLKLMVVDDSPLFRTWLIRSLSEDDRFQVVGYAVNALDAQEKIPLLQPDMLTLDIEMPGKGGMETAHGLRDANLKMLIIFVTAYPDYVFQGYEVQAFHYILKPYQETKLRDVLDRALTELNALAEQYYLIEQKSQTLRLNLRSVCYFKSEKRTIYAFSKQNHETSFYGKLEEVSAEMPSFFQRIHNRYLVNLNYVTKLDKNTCICNGEELPVSRAYKQELSVAFARMMLK